MKSAMINSPSMAVGAAFRVRIGERAITDGLCALLQGMLLPQVSQPPLTANSLLSLLHKMAPPALTLGRSAAPSWLQENTQQVCNRPASYRVIFRVIRPAAGLSRVPALSSRMRV
jgi:hypothetical protein